jgi:hypothetical protein
LTVSQLWRGLHILAKTVVREKFDCFCKSEADDFIDSVIVFQGMSMPIAHVEESWQMAEFYNNKVIYMFFFSGSQ